MPYAVANFGKSTDDPSRFERNVRPARFSLNPKHSLANGLVFAGLGGQGLRLHDYSGNGNHGTLVGIDPSANDLPNSTLGRRMVLSSATGFISTPFQIAASTAFSISFWFLSGSTGTNTSTLCTEDVAGSDFGITLTRTSLTGTFHVENDIVGSNVAFDVVSGTINSLMHLCYVRDGASQTLYRDGVALSSGTFVQVANPGQTYFGICGRSAASANMVGYSADWIVHNRALSAEEIKILADPKNVLLDDLIVPDEPDRSITKRRVAVVRGHSFEKPKVRPQQFELDYDHPLANGLVFAGLGNQPGSRRYNDSSAYGNHGVLTNMDPATDWLSNGQLNRPACDFDGNTNIINAPHKSLLSIGQDAAAQITVAAWVRQKDTSRTYESYVQKGTSTNSASVDFLLGVGAIGTNALWGTGNSGDNSAWLQANNVIVQNTWVHLCGTLSATGSTTGNKSLYANGIVKASGTYAAKAASNTDAFNVGSGGFPALADICDVLMWRRVLTDYEIKQLADPSNVMLSGLIKPLTGQTKVFRGVTLSDAYTLKPPNVHVGNGNGRPQHFTIDYSHPLANGLVFAGLGNQPGSVRFNDSSAYGNHGVLTNMEPSSDWVWDSTLNRMMLNFDGSNERCTGAATSLAGNARHTIAAWVLTNENSTPKRMAYGWSDSSSRGTNVGQENGYWSMSVSNVGSNVSTTPVVTGTWTHLCLIQNGQYRLYVNGSLVHSYANAGISFAMVFNTVGAIYSAVNYWLGSISDPCAWNRALTLTEIQQLADPSNVLLSGLIKESKPLPISINDRHWVGRTNDWHSADNWSRSQGERGGAGVPNENTNVFFD